MDTRELARLLDLARDGRLSDEQLLALSDLLAATPDAEAWWREALALDKQLALALEARLEAASMRQTTRDRIRAQLRSRPPRTLLQRAAPVLLALSLILLALSVGRAWLGTTTGTQPPAQVTPLVPTTPIAPATPTATPLAPEEAATATAAMAQMLRPTYDAQTAIAQAPTDLAATSIPLTATAANMDPATAATVTVLVQTEVALEPFRPATQTARVPTDLAATVVGIQTEDAARTATATHMAPAAAATATADAQTATTLAPFVPATQTAQVPTDLAATVVAQTVDVVREATIAANEATVDSLATSQAASTVPTSTPSATESVGQLPLCDAVPTSTPCVTPTLTTTPRP